MESLPPARPMKDQVDALTRNGVAAAAINSTVREEQATILRRAADGDLRLLYVAPERFSDGRFVAAMRGQSRPPRHR